MKQNLPVPTAALSDSDELLRESLGSDNECSDYLVGYVGQAVSDSLKRRAPRSGLRGGRNRHYTPAEKLAARTVKGPFCWEVQGYPLPHNGYVQISTETAVVFAHRLAWELANGRSIPTGQVVMHSCDNPRCVNPDHLSVGSQKDNVHDAIRKGRWTVRKLSDDDVAAIRSLRQTGLTCKAIAARFGVARNTVSAICTGTARAQRIDLNNLPQKATA